MSPKAKIDGMDERDKNHLLSDNEELRQSHFEEAKIIATAEREIV